jgi:hypothetical protein
MCADHECFLSLEADARKKIILISIMKQRERERERREKTREVKSGKRSGLLYCVRKT